ncbi:MAG: hypothetical protein Q8M93_07275 [Polaromonas sp.]|uniref:hypothetical protein n=1 Tax=Polaromonas sp. TaxID=1869339 RepID=UPI00272FFF5C|nr:hypothetical protein [Polaromonas sp.]MDP2448021.1 hypothetical protein [Polaromonas sp.]MDP3246749.1 hypothetical protein [Polaromonas sp.]MDP3756376.1 hypothetical protein [Polaromonas sp.]
MTKDQRSDLSTLQVVHGTTKRTSPQEVSRFEKFKQVVLPRLAQQEKFAVAFQEATVRKIEAEGEKLVEEAAKIAAEKDVAKQEALRIFCQTVDSTFGSEDPNAYALKLAKLLETNPEMANQLSKVQGILATLQQQKGCHVIFESPSKLIESPPEG